MDSFGVIVPLNITVVIAVYNGIQFIAQALDGVFSQSLRPSEIIVVDDGSTDETAKVVADYRFTEERLKSYSRRVASIHPDVQPDSWEPGHGEINIVLLQQENRGPSAARNRGIARANSEWIAFLDADDIWPPLALQSLAGLIQYYPEAGLVFGSGLNFEDDGKMLDIDTRQPSDIRTGLIARPFEYLAMENKILNGSLLVRKDLILRAGGFSEELSHGEDHDLWLRIALLAPLAAMETLVLLRRRHLNSLSADQAAFYQAKVEVFSRIRNHFDQELNAQHIDVDYYVLRSLWRLAYFFYLNKQPIQAVVTALRWGWALVWLKWRVSGQKIKFGG